MSGVADGPHADTHRRAEYERLRAQFLQVSAEYERLSDQDGTPATVLRALQERLAALRVQLRAWRTGA